MSRLSIEITQEQHNAIKAMAFEYGVSIKDFVLDKLADTTKKSNKNNGNKLLSALTEAAELEKNIKSGSKKTYKTAKDVFDRYR